MPEDIRDDLEEILADLMHAYLEADGDGRDHAVLKTHVQAKFRSRVERVSDWLGNQP